MNDRFYTIKIRRYKKGAYGKTIYGSPFKFEAIAFANGYQAALRDIAHTGIYVSVHDSHGRRVHDASSLYS